MLHTIPPVVLNDLPPTMREAVHRAGWSELMPVQSKTVPILERGKT